MHRQAWIAWLLILLQAGMFWFFSETTLFPVVVVAISLPAVWWRRRWELSSVYLPWIDLVVAGFVLLAFLSFVLAYPRLLRWRQRSAKVEP